MLHFVHHLMDTWGARGISQVYSIWLRTSSTISVYLEGSGVPSLSLGLWELLAWKYQYGRLVSNLPSSRMKICQQMCGVAVRTVTMISMVGSSTCVHVSLTLGQCASCIFFLTVYFPKESSVGENHLVDRCIWDEREPA